MSSDAAHFDEDTWAQLPEFFEHLPEPVRLHVWGDVAASPTEREAARLAELLSSRFETIDYRLLPRRVNYAYYPVIGVMGLEESEAVDFGVRLIGLPAGYQMTSLVAAIQCVSFRGMTSEAGTRMKLHRLSSEVILELITTAEDEAGTVMAQRAFNMAVASSWIRSYLVMGDTFPDAFIRYSVSQVPHLVINGRNHIEGLFEEEEILKHIAAAVRDTEV
jgi:alkyl hydroperoxide reductase subunit AhpF